ncbi:hypothetical protein [Methylobacterium symbioticum]|uniref:Uncharacterized protein n=1 Tax=Methylobacterium symbioticum TaxID=2584084 RepID=A0A509EH13_9HYPH|nr:hypothetical protein [Methylobacterium symbioticum]VUD73451.1 hypothetical protein MET9862_04067 [Methylobacterium symbioticum]
MSDRQDALEARIVALEYALEVLVDCLTDTTAIRPGKIANLLTEAVGDAKLRPCSPEVPTALKQLAAKLG